MSAALFCVETVEISPLHSSTLGRVSQIACYRAFLLTLQIADRNYCFQSVSSLARRIACRSAKIADVFIRRYIPNTTGLRTITRTNHSASEETRLEASPDAARFRPECHEQQHPRGTAQAKRILHLQRIRSAFAQHNFRFNGSLSSQCSAEFCSSPVSNDQSTSAPIFTTS